MRSGDGDHEKETVWVAEQLRVGLAVRVGAAVAVGGVALGLRVALAVAEAVAVPVWVAVPGALAVGLRLPGLALRVPVVRERVAVRVEWVALGESLQERLWRPVGLQVGVAVPEGGLHDGVPVRDCVALPVAVAVPDPAGVGLRLWE